MIEAYTIGAELRFGGTAFAQLEKLARQVMIVTEKVNVLNVEFSKLTNTLKAIGESANIAGAALKEAFVGSVQSVYSLNRNLLSTEARMNAISRSAEKMAASISFSSEAMAAHPSIGYLGGGYSRRGAGGSRRGGGGREGHFYMNKNGPGYSSGHLGVGVGTAAFGIGAALGIAENATIDDIIASIEINQGIRPSDQKRIHDFYRSLILKNATQYAFAINSPRDVALTYLSSAQMLHGLPLEEQNRINRTIMPFAALEAKQKRIPLEDAFTSFLSIAHQEGAYSQNDIQRALVPVLTASISTDQPLTRIVRAASYSVPVLKAGLDMDPAKLIVLQTMLMRAGIFNTKSGTWTQALFSNLIPSNLGAGLFKNTKQKAALEKLGLIDSSGKPLYLNTDGSVDALKVAHIIAEHATKLQPVERMGALTQAFGKQGSREAALFTMPAFIQQLPAILESMNKMDNPDYLAQQLKSMSLIAKSKELKINVEKLEMNATNAFIGPVSNMVSSLNNVLNSDFVKNHPLLTGIGAAVGISGLWKGIKGVFSLLGMGWDKVGGAARSGLSFLFREGGPLAYAGFRGAGSLAYTGLRMLPGALVDAAPILAPLLGTLWSPALNKDEDKMLAEAGGPQFINNKIYIDGKEIATVVTKYQAQMLSQPPSTPNFYSYPFVMPNPGQNFATP